MSGSHRSGSHRDSYRGPDGGLGQGGGYRRDGGGYGARDDESGRYSGRGAEPGGYGTDGYDIGGYGTGGYEARGSRPGGYGTGGGYESGGPGSGGGYGTGGYLPPTAGSGPYQRETGPYRTGSDAYRTDSGGYRTDSGGYRTGEDRYRTDSGGYRSTGEGRRSDAGYRAGSTGYRTGRRRAARERREGRRWTVIAGAVVAAIGVCVLAAFVVLSGVGEDGGKESGQVVGSGAAESGPSPNGERAVVPDSCTIVPQDLTDRLAPGSKRTQADNYLGDERQHQCVWGAYAGDKKRQLTVELRAIAAAGGRTATETAGRTLESERTADESGKALLAGQKLTEKDRPDDLGDEAYIVYSVDDKQGSGEAVGNVRVGNVLITIHYSGSNDGDPLSSSAAMGGTKDVAKAVIQGLGQS